MKLYSIFIRKHKNEREKMLSALNDIGILENYVVPSNSKHNRSTQQDIEESDDELIQIIENL